jgi:acyl dehydratase
MPIDYDKLKNWPLPAVEQRYTARDTILYALGVGAGSDPTDEAELRFVYEGELRALPTMGVVLGAPGFWLKDPTTGVDWRKVLHGEQGLVVHRPLPPAAVVVGRSKVVEILDRGDKGAFMYAERVVVDQATAEPMCTLTSTTVLRGAGGFGGPAGPAPEPHALPARAPDLAVDLATLPQAALIYRLSGDDNPLHADPKVALAVGFPRPILHGLGTFGVAGRAILKACCGSDPARLEAMQVRFSAPVFPGETIRTEIWRDGATVSFRARVVARDAVVLNNGRATIAA